jgi:hypothetical protein
MIPKAVLLESPYVVLRRRYKMDDVVRILAPELGVREPARTTSHVAKRSTTRGRTVFLVRRNGLLHVTKRSSLRGGPVYLTTLVSLKKS